MGGGSFTRDAFYSYSTSVGKSVDHSTGRLVNQEYKASHMDSKLNPKKVMRECCNTEEHPNTIPIILALDVTGSMGRACKETAEALGTIMTSLYDKFKDVQIMVMGIGDLAYDRAPIQISQFESDVRIAEWLDKIWMEHGGGGNGFESYTAAWYMGLRHTKLDCFDQQGRKGIIITMGDEPLNPYLPKHQLMDITGDTLEGNIETKDLYTEACSKFDIFHIAVDDPKDSYSYYSDRIKKSFGELLKQHFIVSTINNLGQTICDCVSNSVNAKPENVISTGDGIAW